MVIPRFEQRLRVGEARLIAEIPAAQFVTAIGEVYGLNINYLFATTELERSGPSAHSRE
jgi:hypothetical protein